MRALGSSFGAWRSLEHNHGVKGRHGLTVSLAIVSAIGELHGLEMVHGVPALDCDAVFISVLDTLLMLRACEHFKQWGIPLRRCNRQPVGRYPLIWCGGQGLHNPMPMSEIFDLCVIGDAEEPLPELLRLWEQHGNSAGFLTAASTVPGVYVPDHHRPGEATVKQSVARDISVSLRKSIAVTLDGSRRIEIARGCRYKCAFCGLGWRAPYRENTSKELITALQQGPRRVHLLSGDAETHTEIAQIRTAADELGCLDQGWTGRLDDTYSRISGQKRYAFGVEGISHRLRRIVGKGRLTDERLVSMTAAVLDRIEGNGKGRTVWHIMAGLPSERPAEILEMHRVLDELDNRRRCRTPRNLNVHWQPFQPIPGTPMQWCAAGSGARRLAAMLRGAGGDWVQVRHVTGRTDRIAAICSALARADGQAVRLLEACAQGSRMSPAAAELLTGSTARTLDPDAPLPWDWIDYHWNRAALRKVYDATRNRSHGQRRSPGPPGSWCPPRTDHARVTSAWLMSPRQWSGSTASGLRTSRS